jgi:hypothetical protein
MTVTSGGSGGGGGLGIVAVPLGYACGGDIEGKHAALSTIFATLYRFRYYL